MLMQRLIEKQVTLGENDALFSRRLGVSRQLWNFTRNGRQPVGWSILRGTLRGFPELTDEVLTFMASNANILAK